MEFDTIWSGAMERAGTAPGLSQHRGQATLHPAAWIGVEDPGSRGDDEPPLVHGDRAVFDRSRDYEALALLRKGVSLAGAARALGTTRSCVRNAAKRRGWRAA